jgi:CubicO group peptidase (beta-lactamase class C family)
MKSKEISAFLQERIEAKDFPSAVYLAAEKGKIVFRDALGLAVVEPEKIEAKIDTIYDLASLTKPLVAGLLCAKQIEIGEINLSDEIAKYLPEFDTNEKRRITIENLLTHTSGFRAWKPLYSIGDEKRETENVKRKILELIGRETLEYLLNSKAVYSDLNFITLGFLLEKVFAASLDEIAKREIFVPLNLQNTFYNPPQNLQKQIAASENGSVFEEQLSVEQGFNEKKIRNPTIWGEVHDGNAYFMNGVSGHAGLFANVFDTCKIAQQFLAEETILLKPETCKLFRTNFTKGFNEARSIAFQLAETKDSTASNALSKDSFGHLGFLFYEWCFRTRRTFRKCFRHLQNRAAIFG